MQLAAACTSQKFLPDMESFEPFNMIFQTAEDGLGDTVKPRLVSSGADLKRVLVIDDSENPLSLADDRIEKAIRENNAKLMVIDPLQAFLGANVDMNRANEVRPIFRKLADIAQSTGCAIVMIGHLNKASGTQSAYRGLGSIDIAAEHDFSKIITIILMFIGACPGSTGGGIKVTSLVVLASTVFSVFRGYEDTVCFRRRISKEVVYRALAIMLAAFVAILIVTGVILAFNEQLSGVDALFESVSAFATVGLSASVTPLLDYVSKTLLVFLMFLGRVGPVSLALAISIRSGKRKSAVLPEGRIIVG